MNNAKPVHWPSIIQLGLSLLVALGLLGFSGMSLIGGVIQFIQGGIGNPAAVPSFMLSASLLLGAVLMLPSAWYAYRRLVPSLRESAAPRRSLTPWVLTLLVVIFVPLLLLVGNWAARSSLAWLFLPPISLLATGLPVLWLVWLGKRGLPAGSPQRQWGLFAAGLAFNPLFIIIIELLALIGLMLLVGLIIAINPELAQDLSTLAMRLASSPPGTDNWLNILSPYLMQPAFLAAVFAYTSLLIPLIEEALKPLGLWLLTGRRLSPAQGFAGGLISGAGFALFENLSALSAGGPDWTLLASLRITTALLHVLTTGLVGWALAHAWTNKRFLRLGVTYSAAVILHGVWNALGIASFSLPALNLTGQLASRGDLYTTLTLVGLGVLTVVNFILYNVMNRRLQVIPEANLASADLLVEITPSLD